MNLSILAVLPEHKIANFQELVSKKLNGYCYKFYSFPILTLEKDLSLSEDFDWKAIGEYNHLIFTSSYGTQIFFEYLEELSLSLNQNIKIISVGDSISRAIEDFNYSVALQPERFNAESLILEMKHKILDSLQREPKNNFLIVTGEKNHSEIIKTTISQMGFHYRKLILYRSEIVERPDFESLNDFLFSSGISDKFICVSSPQCVRNFHILTESQNTRIPLSTKFVCIGKSTLNTVKNLFPRYLARCGNEFSYNGMINLMKGEK